MQVKGLVEVARRELWGEPRARDPQAVEGTAVVGLWLAAQEPWVRPGPTAEMGPGGVKGHQGVYPAFGVPSLSGRPRSGNPAVNHLEEVQVVGVTPWGGPQAWSGPVPCAAPSAPSDCSALRDSSAPRDCRAPSSVPCCCCYGVRSHCCCCYGARGPCSAASACCTPRGSSCSCGAPRGASVSCCGSCGPGACTPSGAPRGACASSSCGAPRGACSAPYWSGACGACNAPCWSGGVCCAPPRLRRHLLQLYYPLLARSWCPLLAHHPRPLLCSL
uniref:Uncharacterized protein n=1 Tax=Paramormyrops kingsleyae TaxID=1676925 RepID=A0A3B3T610_9TELE